MPELPEVETIKNTLNELVLNKTISNVEIFRETTFVDPLKIKNSLNNQTIIGFERVGKHIVFHLTNDLVIISHLRMEGKFFYKKEEEELAKHDLVVFHFVDNTKLVYNDTRRFGVMHIKTESDYRTTFPLNHVGPDPLMLNDASLLEKAFKNKQIPIKQALLDQSIMSGLGNIYVDEVLFSTKVNPLIPAKEINRTKLEEILTASKEILTNAIKEGGTTIKSYHPKEGVSGNFQVSLQAYGKKNKPCPRCGTIMIKTIINGRGTTYCPKCQPLTQKYYKVIGITGPVGAGKSTAVDYFDNLGYKVIDCDSLVNMYYSFNTWIRDLKKIIPGLKIKNCAIDKAELTNILLKNPELKIKLEEYVFPRIYKKVQKEIGVPGQNYVVEAPLLFESKIDELCDETIYIDVNEETQKKHLLARGSDIEKSLKINSSFNKEENKKKATYVIENNSDVANLNKQLDTIFCK